MTFKCFIFIFLFFVSYSNADSFVQYNFGLTQDYNTYTPENIQRSIYNEFSFYYSFKTLPRLFFGISYSMLSSYQSESATSSTTQIAQSPLVSVRYYPTKNQIIGVTIQYTPLSKIYYATDDSEANWSGSGLVIKPGIYPKLSKSFNLAVEFCYYILNYTTRDVVSGNPPASGFSRSYGIPSAGLIWNF